MHCCASVGDCAGSLQCSGHSQVVLQCHWKPSGESYGVMEISVFLYLMLTMLGEIHGI